MVRSKRTVEKHQRTHVSSSPPPQEFHDDFPTPQAFQSFKSSFEKREVNLDHPFDIDVLEKMNFSYLTSLRDRNWLQLLELKTLVFQDYLRILYSNAQTSFDNHEYTDFFRTFIQNTELEISPNSLAKFLDIPAIGDIYIPYTFKSLDACRKISRNPHLKQAFTNINTLLFDFRIVYLIICQVLHPRKGNYGRLYPEDLWFMEKFMENKPINLPLIMCNKMVNDRAHHKQSLPYGCLLSAFIKTKFPSIQSSSILLTSKITFSDHTSLTKMGYRYDKVNKRYTKTIHCHQRFSFEADAQAEE